MEYKKNADGTDFLDENGNKVPIEVTNDTDEAAKVKAQLVEELKELRLQNGLMKGLLEKANTPPEPLPDPNKVLTEDEKIALKVKEILNSEKASDAQANKKAAFEKFVTDDMEFNPENDPTGLKRDALQKKFNQFNTDGLSTVEEFMAVIGDAKTLLKGNDTRLEPSKVKTPYSNVPTPQSKPNGREEEVLSPQEIKLADSTGRTKEELLKIKLKHPDLVRDLLEFVK